MQSVIYSYKSHYKYLTTRKKSVKKLSASKKRFLVAASTTATLFSMTDVHFVALRYVFNPSLLPLQTFIDSSLVKYVYVFCNREHGSLSCRQHLCNDALVLASPPSPHLNSERTSAKRERG